MPRTGTIETGMATKTENDEGRIAALAYYIRTQAELLAPQLRGLERERVEAIVGYALEIRQLEEDRLVRLAREA